MEERAHNKIRCFIFCAQFFCSYLIWIPRNERRTRPSPASSAGDNMWGCEPWTNNKCGSRGFGNTGLKHSAKYQHLWGCVDAYPNLQTNTHVSIIKVIFFICLMKVTTALGIWFAMKLWKLVCTNLPASNFQRQSSVIKIIMMTTRFGVRENLHRYRWIGGGGVLVLFSLPAQNGARNAGFNRARS